MIAIESIRFDEKYGELIILDQSALPGRTAYLTLRTPAEVFEAIRQLKVRGAPAIGIAAAYGLYIGVRNAPAGTAGKEPFLRELRRIKAYLASSRPTAVNLFWALDRMEKRAET
ncbi:MAG: S-methyl-5-thioribose-1-phosphate isomerase, partial [Spirochaetales bacterium]